ncbi:response regulator transcription factor [Sporosarcina aquimarina]|uniref:Response regulator transcription factor n=1 Tax=Sporosarcina aquimarina TaxID=114975 RepID=A0ABU4G080_9BACL|nr:response regulator transcription factor [Sporosarcina aquimarina]MDW0110370.1 response regulator transcription factor [Sporosarcina aquimarina]
MEAFQTKTVLIVEDDPSICTLLEYNLKQNGYRTLVATNGIDALETAIASKPDLIVLDIMLPGMDGIDVCQNLRQQKIDTPIIMLTARGEETDKVLGLEIGADDYMTKPFSPRELTARVKAVLRRTNGPKQPSESISINGLTVYLERYQTELNGELLEFTPKEFELLVHLMKHKNRVLSRDQLLQAVWNYDFSGDTRIVDVHISHLRDKIEADSKKPRSIKTVRGIGYKFEEFS